MMDQSVEQTFQEIQDFISLKRAGLSGTPATEPLPPPVPVGVVTWPAVYSMFGPVQGNGALSQVPGASYAFQGEALTASTKRLFIGPNCARVHWAAVSVVWAPGSSQNSIEIVAFDDGPSNIVQLAVINGANLSTPTGTGVLITDKLRAIVATGISHKHIGFRIKGVTGYTINEVRMDVVWEMDK